MSHTVWDNYRNSTQLLGIYTTNELQLNGFKPHMKKKCIFICTETDKKIMDITFKAFNNLKWFREKKMNQFMEYLAEISAKDYCNVLPTGKMYISSWSPEGIQK